MVEYWPTQIDWPRMLQVYRTSDDRPWLLGSERAIDETCFIGSSNSAFTDVFRLLEQHLPVEVLRAVGPLAAAISTCPLPNWPSPDDAPKRFSEFQPDSTVSLMCSPEKVRQIVSCFANISSKQMKEGIANAWVKLSTNPRWYRYSEPGVFDGHEMFIDYITGWYVAFEEASEKGHGIGIDHG